MILLDFDLIIFYHFTLFYFNLIYNFFLGFVLKWTLVIQADAELTAVRFDDSGLHCAVGTSNGLVALYDLRSSRPLLVKDHMYGDKITDIKFHSAHGSSGNTGMSCNLSVLLCNLYT